MVWSRPPPPFSSPWAYPWLLDATAGPAPPPEAPRRRKRSPARILTLLLIVALVIAGIAVIAYASSSNSKQVQVRNVVRDNVNDTVTEMKQLVEDNTK